MAFANVVYDLEVHYLMVCNSQWDLHKCSILFYFCWNLAYVVWYLLDAVKNNMSACTAEVPQT